MQTHPPFPPKNERKTAFITDSGVDAFLSASIGLAEDAAQSFADTCQRTPTPFDSIEEWHAFDAALERRLAISGTCRVPNAA
jgi:hypothetical protein